MTHDINTIRKAYNRVVAAMTAAKEAGDHERVAQLRHDYDALKGLLAQAKEEEPQARSDARAQVKELKAKIKEQEAAILRYKQTIADLRMEVAIAKDLARKPTPQEQAAYRSAQIEPYEPFPQSVLDAVDAELAKFMAFDPFKNPYVPPKGA